MDMCNMIKDRARREQLKPVRKWWNVVEGLHLCQSLLTPTVVAYKCWFASDVILSVCDSVI